MNFTKPKNIDRENIKRNDLQRIAYRNISKEEQNWRYIDHDKI